MKHKIIMAAILSAVIWSSCGGDHSVGSGTDTAPGKFKVPTTRDTSRTTGTTGEAGNVDNSGSGGALVAKDTAQLQTKGDSSK